MSSQKEYIKYLWAKDDSDKEMVDTLMDMFNVGIDEYSLKELLIKNLVFFQNLPRKT